MATRILIATLVQALALIFIYVMASQDLNERSVLMPKLNKIYTRKQIDAMREDLIAKHGDQCAICKKPRSAFKNRLSVDHNHRTGKVRGLLCFACNKFKIGRNSLASAYETWQYLKTYDPEGG